MQQTIDILTAGRVSVRTLHQQLSAIEDSNFNHIAQIVKYLQRIDWHLRECLVEVKDAHPLAVAVEEQLPQIPERLWLMASGTPTVAQIKRQIAQKRSES